MPPNSFFFSLLYGYLSNLFFFFLSLSGSSLCWLQSNEPIDVIVFVLLVATAAPAIENIYKQ